MLYEDLYVNNKRPSDADKLKKYVRYLYLNHANSLTNKCATN